MSDISLDNDFESNISIAAEMRVAPNWPSFSLICDYMDHQVASLTDDSDSDKVFGNFLDERVSLLDYFEALLLDDSGKKDYTKVPMPPSNLTDANIQVAKRMRWHTNDLFQVYHRNHNFKPSDAEIRVHLECRW